jgi:tetratricopeptide (TPR) repeat protein
MILACLSLALAAPSPGMARQNQPLVAPRSQPRALSPEEAAQFERLQAERNPDEKIRLIEDFLLQYPNSQFKEFAFQSAAEAYQAKNDYDRVITYGELALSENPGNLSALLMLAAAISETTGRGEPDTEERLGEAEGYGRRAIELLGSLRRPPGTNEEAWNRTKAEASSAAHAALGLIALIREDFARAELELREAVNLTANPDAILLYRLGLSHSFLREYDPAIEALDRASALGGVKIPAPQGGTRDLVAEAKDFVQRAKAAAEPPVPAAVEEAPADGMLPEAPPEP